MAKALMARIDDKSIEWIRRSGEFWPGGDIRVSANQWLRAAFHDSSLKRRTERSLTWHCPHPTSSSKFLCKLSVPIVGC